MLKYNLNIDVAPLDPALAESLRKLNEEMHLLAVELGESMGQVLEKARARLLVDLDGPLPVVSRIAAAAAFTAHPIVVPFIEDMARREDERIRRAMLEKQIVIFKGRSVGMTTYESAMESFRTAFGVDAPAKLAEISRRLGSEGPVPKPRSIGAMTIPGPSRVSLVGKNGKREKIDLPAKPNRRMRAALRAGAGLC